MSKNLLIEPDYALIDLIKWRSSSLDIKIEDYLNVLFENSLTNNLSDDVENKTRHNPLPNGVLTSPYGMRNGKMHRGIDLGIIGNPDGTMPVMSYMGGEVVVASKLTGYGNVVYINHDNNTQTRYAHLYNFKVQVGDQVIAGQELGKMGNTGTSSGPHLHFEIRKGHQINNTAATTDPLPVIMDLLNENYSDESNSSFPVAFERAVEIVALSEGGWNNVAEDHGGETIFGLSRKYNPTWKGWKIVDDVGNKLGKGSQAFKDSVNNNKDLFNLAKDLYKIDYWDPCKCDDLPENIAIMVYDMGVNSGIHKSQAYLQETINDFNVNCTVDGYIGNKTIAALNTVLINVTEEKFLERFFKLRYDYYKSIVFNNESQQVFWKGWVNRLKWLSQELIDYEPAFLQY